MSPKVRQVGVRSCPHCGRELAVRHVELLDLSFDTTEMCPCQIRMEEQWRRETQVDDVKREIEMHVGDQISRQYWMKGFDEYIVSARNEAAVTAALRLLLWQHLDAPRFLLLRGTAGTGKTRLGYALVSSAIAAGVAAVPLRAVTLMRLREREQDWRWLINRPRMILLDDVGKEVVGGYAREEFQAVLFELVEAIHGDIRRALIITTEYSFDQLLKRYPKLDNAVRWRFGDMSQGGKPQRIYTQDEWEKQS